MTRPWSSSTRTATALDAALNPVGSQLTVVANSAETIQGGAAGITQAIGTSWPVLRAPDGTAFVQIRNLPPSGVIVLSNHA